MVKTYLKPLPHALTIAAAVLTIAALFYFLRPPVPPSQVRSDRWDEYVHEKIGISLRYPSTLYRVEISTLTSRDAYFGEEYVSLVPILQTGYTYSLSFASVPNSGFLSLDNPRELFGRGPLLTYSPEMLEGIEVKQVTIGNMPAYRVDGCCGGMQGIESDIQSIINNKIFQIVVSPRSVSGDPNENKYIYERILSSVTFIR